MGLGFVPKVFLAEIIQRSSSAFQTMKNVFQSDRFGSPVFNIRHGVVQDTFEKSFHSQPGLVVDCGRDTFDTPTSSQSPDSGFGNPMDRIS